MFEILSQFKPEVIVAGGTTLALVYLIWSNRQRDSEWNKMLTNHLIHEQESRDKLTATLQRLVDAVEGISERIKK